jgi:hypothetical protein
VVSRRPLTAEARVRAPVSPCGICGGQRVTEVFLRVLRFSSIRIIPPWLHTRISSGEMKTNPVRGHNSETWSHSIDINNNNNQCHNVLRESVDSSVIYSTWVRFNCIQTSHNHTISFNFSRSSLLGLCYTSI